MSDFSKLELLVESQNAVQNLKKVESSLNKTESAANSLKNTLKTIGLSIGFAALIRQSLQLENSTNALDKKFKAFFGSSGSKEVKVLTDNFTLANRTAKELLTTSAKFGTATGLGGDQLTHFSSQLSQLAADVAAFHAIDDVNSVLDRFGAATMGRTQGLREFGVQIDTTSQAFKNQIAIIQQQTGATEAQAKQIAILQEAQRQLQYTQGSAGEQSLTAWQQLTNLFENFKDILANIGSILGAVFGPFLKILNKILNLPVVRWIVAIAVVLGLVAGALNKIDNLQTSIYNKISADQRASLNSQQQLTALQEQFVTAKGKELSIQEKIARLKKEQILAENYLKDIQKSINSGAAQRYQQHYQEKNQGVPNWQYNAPTQEELGKQLNSTVERLNKAQKDLSGNMDPLISQFNLLTSSALRSIPGFEKLNLAFQTFLLTNSLSLKNIKGATAAITLKNIAQGIENGLKKIDTVITRIYSAAIGANTNAKVANTAATIANTQAYKAAAISGLKSLGTIAKIAGKLAIIAGLVLVFVDFAQMLVEGIFKGFDKVNWEDMVSNKILLPIWKSIEQKAFNWTGGKIGFDWEGIEEKAKKAQQALEKVLELRKTLDDLEKSYEEWYYRNLNLSKKLAQIPDIQKRMAELQTRIAQATKALADMKSGADITVDKSDSVKHMERLKEQAKIREESIKELQRLQSLLDEFIKLKDKLNDVRRSLQESLDQFIIETAISFDKKNGKLIDNKNLVALNIAIDNVKQYTKEFQAAIKGNKGVEEVQKAFERLKGAYMDVYKFRMKALESEKERILENQRFINDLIRTSIGFQQTSIQGVEASSMKALELQTREKTGPTKEAMDEVAKHSGEIAKIEKQQAELAKQSYDKFADYVRKFDNYIGKTAGKTGNNQLIVVNY